MSSSRSLGSLYRWLSAVILLAVSIGSTPLPGQYRQWRDSTLPPLRRLDGIRGVDFPTILYQYGYSSDRPVIDLWRYSRDLGMETLIVALDSARFDSLARDTTVRPHDDASIVGRLAPLWTMGGEASTGRELQFYPFDSMQTQTWGYFPIRFTYRRVDSTKINPFIFYRDSSGRGPRETIYQIADTGLIASGIAYDWNDRQIYRYPQVYRGSGWQSVSTDSIVNAHQMTLQASVDAHNQFYYVAVTGHLFDELPHAADTMALIQVDVFYEVGHGDSMVVYTDSSDMGGHTVGSDTNQRILYRTFYAQREDIAPIGTPLRWDEYHEIAFPVNLFREGNQGGPLDTRATSKNFDIAVTYLGHEKLALRSIALRDSIGQRMTGTTHLDSNYRLLVTNNLRQYLRDDTGALRSQVHFVAGKDELADATYFAGFRELNRLLDQNFGRTDSIKAYCTWSIPWVQDGGLVKLFGPQLYFHDPFDTIHTHNQPWIDGNSPLNRFGVPYPQPPAIRQHNGGRFGIPLLFDLDSLLTVPFDSLRRKVDDYTATMQRMVFGQWDPDEVTVWPYNNRIVEQHGVEATNAQTRGLPYVPNLGFHRALGVYDLDPATDTVRATPQEPAEVREQVNLSLAYGAQGLFYYAATSGKSMDYSIGKDGANADVPYYYDCCHGLYGRTVIEDTTDFVDSLRFVKRVNNVPVGSVDIPHFYLGAAVRRQELNYLNKDWLNGTSLRMGIGQVLRGLRWRDSYSMQWQARRPGSSIDSARSPRPLPSDEIVTGVESRSPWSSTWDDPSATYVELGLFYTKTGTTGGSDDPMQDTNVVWCVNRRTFETPRDSESYAGMDSATKFHVRQRLDSLTETRVIRLKFNLKHPDSVSQYNFIRVREILPDTNRLPFAAYPRQGLDTAIFCDSSAEVVLRPGGGTLLEITYLKPATALPAADLRFNGGKRLIWDGRRYHLVYSRISNGDSRIYYRRSTYIQRPVNDTAFIGPIQWEPNEIRISDSISSHSDHRTPSLTLGINGSDTLITVVWDADTAGAATRSILLRRLLVNGSSHSLDPQTEVIASNIGADFTQWGTPTIATLDFGEAITFSDTIRGIRAVLRTHGSGANWWMDPDSSAAFYSSILNVSGNNAYGLFDTHLFKYPSLPTFAHITAHDSTCGLVWQEIDTANALISPPSSVLRYARLKDTLAGTALLKSNDVVLSSPYSVNCYPSIDQTQDVWGNIQEGVTWLAVDRAPDPPMPGFVDNLFIGFRALYTPCDIDHGFRSKLDSTQPWGISFRAVGAVPHGEISDIFPNTAALNYRYDSTTQNEKVLFGIVYADSSGAMYQDIVEYGAGDGDQMIFPNNDLYGFGGATPTASANLVMREPWSADSVLAGGDTLKWPWRREYWNRQPVRPAVIYLASDDSLRTTKQFFAGKERPAGYMARGREAMLALENSQRTSICVGFEDA